MKKILAFCFVSVFALSAMAQGPGGRGVGRGFGGPGGFGGGWTGPGPGPQKVVTGQPYSATEIVSSLETLANGNQITRSHQTSVARDGQGRISISETKTPPAASGKPAFTVQSIFDPVAGYRYRLDSATMTAMQASLPPQGTRTGTRPARPVDPNVTTANLGTQVINGVAATGTQVTVTIPAGAIGNTQAIQVVRVAWIATTLQVPVQIKTSDPRFGTTDMELTNIVQAEPNASLFVVPAGYTIKTGGPGEGRGPGEPMGRELRNRQQGGPPPGAQF
jgi:hypothetical protein